MDKDFHYYGTYVAARLAGYKPSESQVIAYAAQYVDDSYGDKILKEGDHYIDFQPIPTGQKWLDIVLSTGKTKRDIWVPFHFLPGKLDVKNKMTYTGPRENKWFKWFPTSWKCTERGKRQFELACLPQSPLVAKMINDIKAIEDDLKLHMTGIRMHVLADTRAHMYYAGTPAWHVNDVSGDVFLVKTDKTEQKIPFGGLLGQERCTGRGAYESLNYLGHGRMGHLPDYPWITYKYKPKWSNQYIVKNNPEDYLKSFKEMVTALSCIKKGKDYDAEKGELYSGNKECIDAVKSILEQQHPLGLKYETAVEIRCKNWKQNWKQAFSKLNIETPKDYDPNEWLNEAKKATSFG
jgi:hypothetical protein